MVDALSFEQIHKSFGTVQALRGVSLQVAEGEVFGLLGPNGAGKTTLIRILMDFIRPDSGRVLLKGAVRRADDLDQVGYLPEERGLYVKHRVLDVMAYFGALKGLSRAEALSRAGTWLERMGLAETGRWRVSRLSKGMGQKVQIASVMLPEPRLCVLDEPFSGLDPVNVRLVQDLIRERREAGLTTILSTHQMNMVEALCDRVALIHAGRLMVYGPVQEVREKHSKHEVRVRLASGAPPPLSGVAEVALESAGVWRLRLDEGITPREVLAALVGSGAGVEQFERLLAPMEDVFIQVVRENAA
ncbi:MAG TPA: ATP-binding cassette domain-containing protein [Candidatus Polarisedimenticolia bacterium]|nr:ATP-binding cassette domain-containing protein [Candidatus Polarisedimenticolia bacterium]